MLKLHIQIHAGTHSHAHRHTHTRTHMLARAHSPQSCATFAVAQQGWGWGRELRSAASAFLPTFCFPLAQIMIPRHIPSHFNASPLSLSLCCSPSPIASPFSHPTAFFLCSLVAFVVAAYLLQRLFAMPRCHCVAAGMEVGQAECGRGGRLVPLTEST